MCASEEGNIEVVKVLAASGADMNAKDNVGDEGAGSGGSVVRFTSA